MPRLASWLASLSDSDIAYLGGSLLAFVIVLTAGLVLLVRMCTSPARNTLRDIGPAHAEEYNMLQVVVVAHDQEAELEVQTERIRRPPVRM